MLGLDGFDDGSGSFGVPGHEVRQAPTVACMVELLDDLISRSDQQVRCREQHVRIYAGECRDGLDGGSTVGRDFDVLDERVEFELLEPFAGRVSDHGDLVVDLLSLPLKLVALTVRQRAPRARQAHDVGLAGSESQDAVAVASDEQGWPSGRVEAMVMESVVLAVEGYALAIEEATQDPDRFFETRARVPTRDRNRGRSRRTRVRHVRHRAQARGDRR